MGSFRSTLVAALLAGVTVFVLLLPASGQDSDPPECFSVFGYVVPCGLGREQPHGSAFALAGAVMAVGLVAVGSVAGRRDHRRG